MIWLATLLVFVILVLDCSSLMPEYVYDGVIDSTKLQ